VFGCVYKMREKQINDWYDRNIKPYLISADQKAQACWSSLRGTPRGGGNVPLLDPAGDSNADNKEV
jgi:hypothetical protein